VAVIPVAQLPQGFLLFTPALPLTHAIALAMFRRRLLK
jgi:uncharacterized phage infection (PIP) family protein YhgE